MAMNISVKWSSDLAALADDLHRCWLEVNQAACDDPFAKIAVVVNDNATAKWLRQYLLLERRIPQVMMDLEFVKLPEFVNDWLWAVCGKPLRERKASLHPYSKNVLTWRIYRLLEQAAPDGEWAALLKYVQAGGQKSVPERRHALSAMLAALYDDYLNSRFMTLRNWENGVLPKDSEVPPWQVALYRALAAEDPETYAKEYEEALRADADAAFANGFPRYRAVFLFDLPFIPAPTMLLLKKMAEALPMAFWNFNPKDDWLADTPSQAEVKRQLKGKLKDSLAQQRDALKDGSNPATDETAIDVEQFYNSPEERLLGAMASGARAVIGALCDDCDGNVEVLPGRDAFNGLKDNDISVHSAYSRRRELEAVKDGLHDFLKTGAAPHEALVLCADWAAYAPVVETVFPPDSSHAGYIPIATEPMQGNSPIMESFDNLLKFRGNRFEVSAVFALLALPAIRSRYGLDETAVDALHDMVKQANIHWGVDDDDVKGILGISGDGGAPYPFTWQRGLERLTAELLYGFTDDKRLLDAGAISQLHPCGHVEGERAEGVAALWALVEDLKALRRKTLRQGNRGTAAELRDAMLDMLKTFYHVKDDNLPEFNMIRKAITGVAESAEKALGHDGKADADVFVKAVQEALRKQIPGRRCPADAVQFAPLNAYTATPHKFVWICGLNGGSFPKAERRPSYDLVGRHPSLFDATSREKDAFALLKATLCAGQRLAFSYVGKEMRNNENIPPSVLLDNLLDYFKASGIPCPCYSHPLQGYSRRYFFRKARKPEELLPVTYSSAYKEISDALAEPPEEAQDLLAFPPHESGVTEIALDDLVEFASHPNQYLFKKRLAAATPWFDDLNDSECLEAKLDKALKRELALGEEEGTGFAALSVETGHAPDVKSAELAVSAITMHSMAEAYREFEQGKTEEAKSIELTVEGKAVRLTGTYRTMEKDGARQTLMFVDTLKYADDELLVRHLAANAAFEGGVTIVAFSPDEKPKNYKPVGNAREKLAILLAFATSKLPPEYPDYAKTAPKDDKLPDQLLTELRRKAETNGGETDDGQGDENA